MFMHNAQPLHVFSILLIDVYYRFALSISLIIVEEDSFIINYFLVKEGVHVFFMLLLNVCLMIDYIYYRFDLSYDLFSVNKENSFIVKCFLRLKKIYKY